MKKQISFKEARRFSVIGSALLPVAVFFLLIPCGLLCAYFSSDEFKAFILHPLVWGLSVLWSVLAMVLQNAIWGRFKKSYDRSMSPEEQKKLIRKTGINQLLVLVLLMCLTLSTTLAIIYTIIPLSIPYRGFIAILYIVSFYCLAGVFFITMLIGKNDLYFSSVYTGTDMINTLSVRLIALVFINSVSLVGMFVAINTSIDIASLIDRRPVIPGFFINIIFGFVALVFIYQSIWRIKSSIINPVVELSRAFRVAASGDFRQEIFVPGTDEISEIATVANEFFGELRNHFKDISQVSGNLADSKEQLTGRMEQLVSSVEEINANVGSANHQIEDHSANVSETSAAVEQMARNIDSLGGNIRLQNVNIEKSDESVRGMLRSSGDLNQSTKANSQRIGTLVGSAETNGKVMAEMVKRIEEMTRSSAQLLEANKLISDVAGQTNLLAMNAAIEAAHAGEAGKGFAVVSDEIRKLAETSSAQSKTIGDNLDSISGLIEKLSADSKNVQKGFRSMTDNVAEVDSLNKEIVGLMDVMDRLGSDVAASLKEMNQISGNVLTGSEEMQQGNKEIIASISNMNEISQRVSDAVKEIKEGTGIMMEFTGELKTQNSRTDEAVDRLNGIISQFKI